MCVKICINQNNQFFPDEQAKEGTVARKETLNQQGTHANLGDLSVSAVPPHQD